LHGLYDQAVEAMTAQRWVEAQTVLRQLEALEPGYRNLASLRQRADRELEMETQLATWYDEARAHMALGEWDQALEALDRIRDRQKGYRDTGDLIDEVRAKILVPCPRCGTPTPSGHQFCAKCGSPIRFWVCWRCQSPVPETRKFCGKCGAPHEQPQVAACPRCGHENPRARRFCGRCGYELRRP